MIKEYAKIVSVGHIGLDANILGGTGLVHWYLLLHVLPLYIL